MKKFTRLLAALVIASSLISWPNPAIAATATLHGDSALENVLLSSQDAVLTNGVVWPGGYGAPVVYNPKASGIGANTVSSLFGTVLFADAPYPQCYDSFTEAVFPEQSGWKLGGTITVNFDYTATLTSYKVSKTTTGYTLVYGYNNAKTPDPLSGVFYGENTLDFKVEGQIITEIQPSSKTAKKADLTKVTSIPGTLVTFDTDPDHVAVAWSELISAWHARQIDPSVAQYVTVLNNAFAVSFAAANQNGITLIDTPSDGSTRITTYDPAKNQQLVVDKNAKGVVDYLTWANQSRDLNSIWLALFGQAAYGPQSITYDATSRTYTATTYSGYESKITIDGNLMITNFIGTMSDPNADPMPEYSTLIRYKADAGLIASWWKFGVAGMSLANWATNYGMPWPKSAIYARSGKYVMVYKDSSRKQVLSKFDASKVSAANITAIFKLLGITLK